MKIEINGTPEEVREFLSKGAEAQGNIELTPVKSQDGSEWNMWTYAYRYSRSKGQPVKIQGMDINHIVNALVYEVDNRTGTGVGLLEDSFIFRALVVNLALKIKDKAEEEED